MNLVHERTVDIERESVSDLIRDLRDETMIMVRQQIELARTETSEKVSSFAKDAAGIGIWSAVLYAGFLFILASLTFLGYVGFLNAGVSASIASWLMPLITGVVVAAIGGILLNRSIKALSKLTPVPNKTLHSIKEDQQWIKNRMR